MQRTETVVIKSFQLVTTGGEKDRADPVQPDANHTNMYMTNIDECHEERTSTYQHRD